ncbi:MAG TPA: low-complexity protein [Cyanobacteria bacterium UBA11149]|nr:low-complexity protein [Cyanobacteria bacterium UBA11367]HBE56557.1 low-complexity protein [Cyanobacteria bacterium UBA11366]HBK62481.1 low-complexity protein [Cyanobacteria bacterium UBA11166]HBR76319.1 low-complexity protein [Cyanobacteria bacterium UBA11159]HBS70291.1 low-complexity protein [Cyanobacteria bacterium UBA11153]HBW91305.1 low-complexity protein [Cyanobacteria bacterium UBA11149]HCA93504.1 low-complexity protein [Cyanobacteria bacterium UBA9226]
MTNLPDPSKSSPNIDNSNYNLEAISRKGQSSAFVMEEENPEDQHLSTLSYFQLLNRQHPNKSVNTNRTPMTMSAIAFLILGLAIDNIWLEMAGVIFCLIASLPAIWLPVQLLINQSLSSQQRSQFIAVSGVVAALVGLANITGLIEGVDPGSLAEWTGALGQILIAILAVYIAWQQYVISKDLTIQQNTITQQQTIDTYFQGICDLALDDEGLLEDWPQERAFCEGRTAAILTSVDPQGKAKVLRFLSQSRLLAPLKRDRHLGRPILDGNGGYQEDRLNGVRVIDLNVMLAGSDLSDTDLRWTELSEANMVRANLTRCDLVGANLSRTILYEANLAGADLRGVRLFYGSLETATPRSRGELPNYQTGENTGAVVEKANFTGVQRLDEDQRRYCCYWCGEHSRKTIPGGCEGIPNKLGR